MNIGSGIHKAKGDFLNGGGELGALMRQFDWQSTPLGPPDQWPHSLKMATRIMLTSRQPMWIGWGKDLTYLYNDPYKSIIGGKHPWALGRAASEVWREIWDDIGPMLDTALGGDRGTYVEAQFLIMERNGYPEETYYTFSYSPIPNDDGSVGGIICANSDDTQKVIGERQIALLRELAAGTVDARTWREACERSAAALSSNTRDIPFALIYLTEPESRSLSLVAASGITRGHPAAPEKIETQSPCAWPVEAVLRKHEPQLVSGLAGLFSEELPHGPWKQPPSQAAVLPILAAGETGRAGVLVAGLNPHRLYDESYRGFMGLAAGQIGAAIANAQAYEEERRRAEALAEIDRAKTTFFSNVSHEFRTPLTLMLGPLEDALNDPDSVLDDPQRDRLETAHRNSVRLLKLVNSLLDFSRIEAGRVEASYVPTDLATLTEELVSNFRSATERAGLALLIDCQPLEQPVYVDRDMWEKIVLNLLSNAFKFTFDGHLAVELHAIGDAVQLSVRDTGVGIPVDELPRLFERFHRVEGQRSRSFEGSGIGLALVQELVRLHGGSVRVESEVGKGTVFYVTIPFGTAHLPANRIHAGRTRVSTALGAGAYVDEVLRWLPEDEAGDAQRDTPAVLFSSPAEEARILIVDDNADMRNYTRRLLASRWAVETADDGEDALHKIRKRKPDLVLSDIMMPKLDGFGLLREIRGDSSLRDLPVILLSARAGEEARVEGLDAGADDYLTKPFSARELMARVNANLALARVRRDAIRDLRESEARFRNMADHAPMMMWLTDPVGNCTYVNRGWCEFTGRLAEEAQGFGGLEVTHPDDRKNLSDRFLAANATHEPFRLEYRLRRRDGEFRWVLSAGAPRFADNGQFLGYIGSIVDITERKQAEEILRSANETLELRIAAAMAERAEAEAQLRQAQKMEAIGKLTGGVAHDFNNVLQVISGNLQLLSRDVAGNLRAEQRLQTALGGVSRGAKLASQLLAFGRRQPLAPKVLNAGRLLRTLDDLLRRALGEEVEIETVVAGGLWNTFADVVQLENALLNLAINSRDAMNARGKLTIEAGNAFLDDQYAQRQADVAAGQYVMIAVSDTGCGIAPDLLERVFEPFFTTKPEGQGTGLGLSMVYGFVKQSGGHIRIYSEPGQGTTVRMYLPRSRALESVDVEADTSAPVGGSETILVVEDDDEVRATVVEMLTDLGYRVLRARDAQSAFAIVESGVPIDLLFTDIVMPGPMRSTELARRAKERLPGIAVVFTSGYTENAVVHGGRLDEGVDLLSKPYTREMLARKLRQCLRNKQQARAATPHSHMAPPDDKANAPERLRLLYVEDDALIRMSTTDMLTGLGHEVLSAENAPDALKILKSEAIDVLITDVGLPGISGSELAVQACRLRPELKVVFASGYEILPAVIQKDFGGKSVVLGKPYDDQALANALRSVIAIPVQGLRN